MIAATLPTRANADLIEEYYLRWLENPDSVDPTWRAFFQGFTLGLSGQVPVLAGSASMAPALALQDSQIPAKVPVPWGSTAASPTYIRTIPIPSQIGITNCAAWMGECAPSGLVLP